MAAAGLAFLATTPRRMAQYFLTAPLRLSLVARHMIEVIGFDHPVQLTTDLIREGTIA
jgi:hypothetical protein